jgi:putative heme iron utilization protein
VAAELDLRALLEGESSGALATLSAGRAGWPFASVVSYALTEAGEPLLLLSRLAEHTHNIEADPRASLLVRDQTRVADPLASARITILGRIEVVSAPELAPAQRRYLARHPQAAEYISLGDFHLYVLRVREARFVGGFGEMGWMDAERFRASLSLARESC